MIDKKDLFIKWLPSLVGIQYLKNGRDLRGFDCFGFILWVYNIIFKYNIQDIPNKNQTYILKELEDNWAEIIKDKIQTGDLITCLSKKNKSGLRFYNHAGIAISPTKFIHCAKEKGVLISNTETYNKVMEKIKVFRFKNNYE